MMLTEKQRGVLGGMVAGLGVTILGLGAAIVVRPQALLPGEDVSSAIVHALRWDVLLVVWLALNVGMLAKHRFFTPADIDGGGLSEGTSAAKVLQSILQNTLEQVVLAFSVHLIWAAAMPRTWQAAVPAAAMLFFVGRLSFWRGYAHGAPARAVGFALTFYPTVGLLVLSVGRLAWEVVAGGSLSH